MKVVEIRKLSTAELATESTKLREEIVEMKRRMHLGEVQNVRVIRHKRKDLARMLTDSAQRAAWGRNGLAFAETADLYSMPQHAADVILAEPQP